MLKGHKPAALAEHLAIKWLQYHLELRLSGNTIVLDLHANIRFVVREQAEALVARLPGRLRNLQKRIRRAPAPYFAENT